MKLKLNRIYICHTYYHVYVSLLKELNNSDNKSYKVDIVLSKVSTNFKNLKDKLINSGIFNNVFEMNEKNPIELLGEEIDSYLSDNLVVKLVNNIKYAKTIAKRLSKYVNIDFSNYDEIFVYCDSDPIGYYLNYKKIKYCAVEDGLDSLKYSYQSKQRFFGVKKVLASLGLIFMPNGFSKYAVAVEVNDKTKGFTPKKKTVELSRKTLVDNLKDRDKKLIYDIFMGEYKIRSNKTINDKTVLLIVQAFYPGILDSIDKQVRLYRDLINEYCKGFIVYIKPHPLDRFEYDRYFNDCIILEKYFPLEALNFSDSLHFNRALTVCSTSIDAINFVDEKIIVGMDFLEKYK